MLESLKLLSPFSPLYLQIKFKPRLNVCSQKFAMVICFGSLKAELPKATRGLGAKPPAAGDWGSGIKPTAAGGLGAEPPTLKSFVFFLQK